MNQAHHHTGLLFDSSACAGHARAIAPRQTPIQTSVESGHALAQVNATRAPALLREAACVDAQKTKSLCCAAAGIISPPISTAKAPIPHETLREAGPAEPTLIASNCPHAQLVKGYKQSKTVGNSLSPLQATAIKACISNAIDRTLSTPSGSFATTEQMAQGIYGALQAAGFLPQQAAARPLSLAIDNRRPYE